MRTLLLTVAALAAFCLPASAQNQPSNAAAEASTQQFVGKAAIGNMFEIDAARLAEQKTANPAYLDFAKMIIADHTKAGEELKAQVMKISGLQIPSGLDQEHQQQLQQLRSENGANFERHYRTNQIEGHQQAIQLFRNYGQSGQTTELKSWAQTTLRMQEKHLQHAEALPIPSAPVVGTAQPQLSPNAPATTGNAPPTGISPAQDLVNDAVPVLKKMENDPKLVTLIKQAKGLFIVPEFGRGAFIVGGRGGAGFVVAHPGGMWSDPAFFDIGGISVGPQIGGAGGSVVFLLMSQGALDAFKSGNNFALNAGAGLSIINYSAETQASWGQGDIIMWSDTPGIYVGATISVTDVSWDQENNRAYYGPNADMTKILNGTVHNTAADKLKQALPA